MCGIAGIINKSDFPVEESHIRKMTDLVIHRGPDDSGIYLEKNLGLGHRRLSIIDLSMDGHQPMSWNDRYVIVYNGEIYNYIEIKDELILQGYSFRSQSDTEVILAAYDRWGTACVSQFNGMWSFTIFDRVKNTLFCSRDRFGVKPFYYVSTADFFAFGSEIKQLFDFLPTLKANEEVLLEYLVTGYEEYKTGTFYQNIFKLQPGHNLVYDLQTHQFEINTYYEINLNHNVNGLTYDEAEKQFRDHFARSVRLRLRSDVKVGTCLSGGLDSSYLAAVAGKSYLEYSGKGFTAITARSTDYRKDESGYARMVAESAKLEWHIVTPGFDDFSGYLDEVITTQEEPFGSPSIFMQYFVMKEASKLGCKVMLDGQGGDETLLGYERNYAPVIRSQPLLNLPINFYRAASNSKLSARELLMYMFYFNSETIRINRLKQRCSFLKSEYLHIVDTGLISETCKVSSNIFELQKIEVKKSPLPALLKYEDRNSMKHSVEARLPFLDYQLLEFSLSLPTEMKMNQGWTKFILRKSAEKVLPSEIAWRKNKFGFEAPVHQWLGNNPDIKRKISGSALLRKYCSSVLFDMKDTSLLWRLYNIAKWEEVFNVSAD